MIRADLHSHTKYSHGADEPEEMFAAANARGLEILGFSEHSPRPQGYDYTHEYREKLAAGFAEYVSRGQDLKKMPGCRVLLAMEMDWLDGQEDFIRKACSAHDFDYLLGSVHFIGRWGFDDGDAQWKNWDDTQRFAHYERYFALWRQMLSSGIFQIAAHPDLIKIFSAESFHKWLSREKSREQIADCLDVLKQQGMAMEISSAGLRKPCREIYPCPTLMVLAAKCGVDITFASDAHCVADVGRDFARLANYARAFGFSRQAVFCQGEKTYLPF